MIKDIQKKIKAKNAEIQWDQIAKIILALVALIILIYIITQAIAPEFTNQGDKIKDVFKFG